MKLRESDADILEKIYYQTKPAIMKYVLLKCNHIEDVKNIMQNVYLRFLQRVQKYGIPHIISPQKYLFKIARGELSKYYKEKDFTVNHIVCIDEIGDYNATDYELEQELNDSKLENKRIWEMIKQSELVVVKIFVLYFLYEMKITEIADILGTNESYVKNKLYRTLRNLKVRLSQEE